MHGHVPDRHDPGGGPPRRRGGLRASEITLLLAVVAALTGIALQVVLPHAH